MNVVVHPANIQDRDGGLLVLKAVRRLFPFIERIFADGGYQGEATAAAVRALGPWQLEIVKRSDHTVGFEVLPQRWILGSSPRTERTFAWLGRCRRLAKDYENRTRFAVAYIHLAMIPSCSDALPGKPTDPRLKLPEPTLTPAPVISPPAQQP